MICGINMDPSSDSHVIKFTNPKCGTKFLLLQRMCGIEEPNNKATCSASTSSVVNIETNTFSRFPRNLNHTVINKCNSKDSQRANCISLPLNINSESSDTNNKKSTYINRKRKRMKEKRKRQRYSNQYDCYPPNPVPSREPYLPKPRPSEELNPTKQLTFIEPILPRYNLVDEPYKPETIVKSRNVNHLRQNVSIPSINLHRPTFDDTDITGTITQKILGQQPSPNNFTKNDSDNSAVGRINLSISDESHTRVLLTPLEQGSHVNTSTLEPELIVLSSESSNKSSMSEIDSNNQSPSLLDIASVPIDVAPSEAVVLKKSSFMSSKNCKHHCSQKLATTFEASITKNSNAREVNISKKRKLIPSADLQPDNESVEVNPNQNEEDGQYCCSLSVLKSKYIEDIDKGSRKCLKLIISVLCSHFDSISPVSCLKVLENNKYNILTTLLELQSLSSTQL